MTRTEKQREYHRNHARVRSNRGRAVEQSCVTCCQQAQEWAQVHGTDGSDPFRHYMSMCRSCHGDYDRVIKGARITASLTGHPTSNEARQKMRAAKLGTKRSPEAIEKTATANRGRTHTEESRQRTREAAQKRSADPAYRQKLSNAQRGREFSDEHHAKLKAAWERRRQADT